MKNPYIEICGRKIGLDYAPLVIAEIGINHNGEFEKAIQMVDDAKKAGCECVKFQCHVIDDEMIPAAKSVIPGNSVLSIWHVMAQCALSEAQDIELKKYVESQGMIYMSTPFSRAAAVRLEKMNVPAYKIGSGECNNYPLIKHIAAYGKPVILSTGMNDIPAVEKSVDILRKAKVPFALMHCTSIYPTPPEKVRLGAMKELMEAFPDAVVGLSDHTKSNMACLAAAALGASLLERHYTSSMEWNGNDIEVSMDPAALKELIEGSRQIQLMRGGSKTILPEEKPTIDFAYATVVTTCPVKAGDLFSESNIWVKRPGTGEIKAVDYENVLGKKATQDIPADTHVKKTDVRW